MLRRCRCGRIATFRCQYTINNNTDYISPIQVQKVPKYPSLGQYISIVGTRRNETYWKLVACERCLADDDIVYFHLHPDGWIETDWPDYECIAKCEKIL